MDSSKHTRRHLGSLQDGNSTAGAAGLSRRDFLNAATSSGVLAAATGMGLGSGLLVSAEANADEVGPLKPSQRRTTAFRLRRDAARRYLTERTYHQISNGDEDLYHDKRASFTKCLPHNELGEVDPYAYADLLNALDSGDPPDFENIPLSADAERKLANPQAAYAFDMTGTDAHATEMEPAPAFDSAEMAAELGEIYWQALTRDISYRDFETDSDIAAAINDLNNFSAMMGPKENGQVTAGTIFRGDSPGDLSGPYISQFLWQDVPYGPATIVQRYLAPVAGEDFMIDYNEWLAIQRGAAPVRSITFDTIPRYINNGRALGEYVHKDVAFQSYFNAALIISSYGSEALDPDNPYLNSNTQGAFVTFGLPHLLDFVAKAARVGLEGAWFHKWLVHRRLRGEVFAARVENQLNGSKDYGINPEILNSAATANLFSINGNRLLPQAFPEGSPTHPAYPAGHAVLAGACTTVLKAFFNEDFVIPNPVEASADGQALPPWSGKNLTLGHEINKLASNISVGRCTAGVHYRSDSRGILVGENQAIGILRDYSQTYNELFYGFTLTRFDGQRIRIVDGTVIPI